VLSLPEDGSRAAFQNVKTNFTMDKVPKKYYVTVLWGSFILRCTGHTQKNGAVSKVNKKFNLLFI
jgi:hypothetical protein